MKQERILQKKKDHISMKKALTVVYFEQKTQTLLVKNANKTDKNQAIKLATWQFQCKPESKMKNTTKLINVVNPPKNKQAITL